MEKERKVLVVGHEEETITAINALKQLGIWVVAACSVINENSLRVLNANEIVCVGPEEDSNFIFNIVEIATSKKVDAIYCNNDFLSDHPKFMEICQAHNLVVITSLSNDADSIRKQIISVLNLKSVSMNFGRGSYNQLKEDMIIEVPLSGKLTLIDCKGFKKEQGHRMPDRVIIKIPKGRFDSQVYVYNEIRIFWIKERREWVAFRCCEVANAMMYVDGPYALDQDGLQVLARIFGINDLIPLRDLAKTSPEKLDELKKA